jgi:thioredoxin reductase (NADPH)
MNKQTKFFDVIILGAGPAGFSAAIYSARGNLKTAILDINMFGGQPANYLELENYPAFPLVNGFELMEKFETHVDKFGVEKFPMCEIQKVDLFLKEIETNDTIFKAKSIIIATGAKAKKLNIKGEDEFKGRGVSYCAICDGAFYKNKIVTVVGGGNSALEEAIYLTKFAQKVYVIHRREELRADKIVQERAFKNDKIEFILNAIAVEIQGKNTVESVILKDLKTNEIKTLKTDGLFPYIGFEPNVEYFNAQLKQTKNGFIETDINMQSSINGVFAAGDVRNTPLRQVITAASDGAIAACSAVKYIEMQDEYKSLI